MIEGFARRQFATGAGTLSYLANDQPGLPKLLILHGVNTCADYFDDFMPYIAGRYDIVAPDFRGHGASFRSDEPYSLRHYAENISLLMATLIREPCFVIGMSLGGRVGLKLAAAHPQLVSRLVVVDVGPDVDPVGLARISEAQARLPQSFPDYAALRAYYATAYRNVPAHYVDHIVRHGWRQAADGSWVTAYDRRIWQVDAGATAADAAVLNALLPAVTMPVLVIRGGLSDILKADDARRFVRTLPDARLIEVPGTTHGVIVEAPEICAREIDAFLLGG